MKQKKLNIKVFLLLLALIGFAGMKAQTCGAPISLTVNTGFTALDSTNLSLTYYKFTANNTEHGIKFWVKNSSGPQGKLQLKCYKDNCGSLPTSEILSIITTNADTFYVDLPSVLNGIAYLIELRNFTPTYLVNRISISNTRHSSRTSNALTCAPSCTTINGCNLVCNGSFECLNGTPTGHSGIFNGYVYNWGPMTGPGTADVFSSTFSFTDGIQSPCNQFGNQSPQNGNSYAGIIWSQAAIGPSGSDGTEYIQTQLTNPLTGGVPYTCSMWIKPGDMNQYQMGISGLGIYLTTGALSITTATAIPNTPTAVETNTTLLNQILAWTKITFTFTASGGEDYLTIGRPAGSSTFAISQPTSNCSTWTGTEFLSYLYIDNVSLVPRLTVTANANFPVSCSGAAVNLTATSNIGGTTYTWQPGNLSGSSVNVNPTSTTTYTLLASVPGCSATSTASTVITVTVTPQVITTSPSLTLCANYSTTLTANASVNPATITWMPGSIVGSPIVVTPTATTIYTVTANAANGCNATKTVQVTIFTPPGTFTLSASSYSICTNLSQSSTLTATGTAGLSYTWNPGALSGAVQTVTPASTTIYTTTALSSGCVVTKTISVAVQAACCTSTVPALTTTSLTGVTITGPKVINFDLTIYGTNTVTSFQTGEFLIAPNVKITVVGVGNEFRLIGAHLYACSTTMWKGIDVADGSRFVSYESASTGNSTLIEDAYTAVNMGTVSSIAMNVPLEISNTIFNKNYASISIGSVNNPTVNWQIKQNVFTSRTLTFTPTSWPTTSLTTPGLRYAATTTTGLTPPYLLQSAAISMLKSPYTNQSARYGVILVNSGYTSGSNYIGVAIGTATDNGASDFNLFDALMYGIDATNSNFSSINNVYQNTQRLIICTPRCYYDGGTAINVNVNNNLNAKLDLTATGTYSTSYSVGNRFWNCHKGVDAINLYRFDCNYATFRSTQTTTAATSALLLPGAVGISNNTNRFEHNIKYNKFSNINNALSMIVYAGTYTLGASTYNGVLANNVFIDFNYFGAQLTNATALTAGLTGTAFLNNAINLQSATTSGWNSIAGLGLRVGNNTINRAFRGVYVDNFAYSSSVQTNTLTLLNDTYLAVTQHGIHSGNTANIAIANNKLNAVNTTNTLVTLVYVGASPASAVTCNSATASYQGYEFNSNNGVSVWKGNDMTNHARGMILTTNGIIGTQGGAGNPSDNRWWGSWTGTNYGTYVDITSDAVNSKLWIKNTGLFDTPLPGGPAFGQTYGVTTNTITTTGTYVCGSPPPPTMMSMSSSSSSAPTMLSTNAANASVEEQYVADNTTYRYLDANPTVKNSNATYVNFYNAKANSSMDKFKQVEANLYNGQIAMAQSINNAVTVGNAVEGNYKNYYAVFAKYKNNTFSSADSATLINLAKLCPGKDGSIVYQARALYNLIYKTVKVYKEDCSTTSSNGSRLTNNVSDKETLKNNWSVELFPNPTKGNFTLVSKAESEVLTVTITDIAGKIIYNNTVNTSNFIVNLDVNTKAGVYLINIKNSTNESITKKLVIAD